MKKAKTAYLHSLLALLVCISMFIGSTFAWFTDSVSSVNNIITSGNLDLELYWTDDLTTGTWYNVEEAQYNTIFNYDNWEPGYTDVKYLKVVNKGSLAFQYQLVFTPVGEVGKLAEVIDVYYANDGVAVQNRSDLANLQPVGLLKSIMNGGKTADGMLLPAGQTNPNYASGETILTVAMSMLTTAGNDYQSQSVGDGFTVTVMATQVENEFDSFGKDYDTDAEFPAILTPSKGEADITATNGQVDADVTISGGSVSATVPAGVAVDDGTEKLTLTVTPLEKSTSDVTPVDGEVLVPVDVHIDGVSESNTTPIIINLGEILPKYLNMGNYQLYHVEDGVTETMNLVASAADLVNHNDYTYDPATGEVSVALATFSEVALVANSYNVWKGGVDYSWYENSEPYIIYNADQLNGLGYIVSGYNEKNAAIAQDSFEGKTVTLARNIDINGDDAGEVFYPIGYRAVGEGTNKAGEIWYKYGGAFEGTFDGAGHTIAGIRQRTWDMDGNYDNGYWKAAMGLFGYVFNGTVKNLTMDDFYSEGEFAPTGCVTAYAGGTCTFENISLVNCHPQTYNTGVAGIIGWDSPDDGDVSNYTFKNITIDSSNTISALWGSWDVAAGGIMGRIGPDSKANFIDCTLSPTIDVYNDVCANYQYYWYRYSGMVIGTVDKQVNGAIVLDNITATNCVVDFGDRHDYVYCEFVANTKASYTHEHQFSRIDHKDLEFTDKNGDGEWQAGETITGCKHDHKAAGTEEVAGLGVIDKENNSAVYLPFRQLFGGYGWGVRGASAHEGIQITVINPAIQKFQVAESLKNTNGVTSGSNGVIESVTINLDETITIGDYFEVAPDATVYATGVNVSISAVDDTVRLLGTFTLNESDWTKSILKITETSGLAKDAVTVAEITIQDYNNCVPTTLRVLFQNSTDNDTGVGDDW